MWLYLRIHFRHRPLYCLRFSTKTWSPGVNFIVVLFALFVCCRTEMLTNQLMRCLHPGYEQVCKIVYTVGYTLGLFHLEVYVPPRLCAVHEEKG